MIRYAVVNDQPGTCLPRLAGRCRVASGAGRGPAAARILGLYGPQWRSPVQAGPCHVVSATGLVALAAASTARRAAATVAALIPPPAMVQRLWPGALAR
jgi:hypothetical protein